MVGRVIRNPAAKLTRSGSCPAWVAAWAIMLRIAEWQEVSPYLLQDQVRGLGAQHGPGAALVGLRLAESRLDLPALGVRRGQVRGRGLDRVEQRGEQPVGGGVLSSVVGGSR